jgi:lysophospholipase L1-like esterase
MIAILSAGRRRRAAAATVALLALVCAPALAEEAKHNCDVPAYLLSTESVLAKVGEAARPGGKLDILVIGSRSSSLAAVHSPAVSNAPPNNLAQPSQPSDAAYPSKLQAFLRERLPALTVNVSLEIQSKKTAEEVVAEVPKLVGARKPNLVIWQTGTVDAMRSIDPEEFRAAMDEGVAAMKAAGTDVILMNLQYSPRTETMISTAAYIDNMRVVAQQHDVPLFDRFAIMREWSESGDFDLFSPTSGGDLAKKVHECLARGLATFIIDAARVNPADLRLQR